MPSSPGITRMGLFNHWLTLILELYYAVRFVSCLWVFLSHFCQCR
ncbi:hypothetical protein PS850_03674 [Pseudomonas fluorescens]|nr:hypothetical protein PS850_03674 [Pseudomonas fluorescens]